MQIQQVDVVISPDGDVRLEVRGVKGPNCLKLTEALEQSLGGDVVARQQTPEYQEQATQEEQGQQWRIGGF